MTGVVPFASIAPTRGSYSASLHSASEDEPIAVAVSTSSGWRAARNPPIELPA